MILATHSDRQRVLKILKFSFKNNPGVNALIGRYRNSNRLQKILEYSVDYALRRNGLYLSDDNNSVAICYNFRSSRETIIDFLSRLNLIIRAIPFFNIFKISAHVRYIKNSKPRNSEFLYFWYLGANAQAAKKGSTQKLIADLFNMAKEKGLDIYAETTMLRNRMVYERFGFETFKHWYNRDLKLSVWFLKKKFS